MQIMDQFAEDLNTDLKRLKETMAEHRRDTDSYFGGVKTHLGELRAEVQGAMKSMSTDITVSSRILVEEHFLITMIGHFYGS
jgi:hypothetical protein